MEDILHKLSPLIIQNQQKLRKQRPLIIRQRRELSIKSNENFREEISKKYFNEWISLLNTDEINAQDLINSSEIKYYPLLMVRTNFY